MPNPVQPRHAPTSGRSAGDQVAKMDVAEVPPEAMDHAPAVGRAETGGFDLEARS